MLKFGYLAVAASAVALSASAQVLSAPGDVRIGRELAITTCSECHLVVARRLTSRGLGGPPDFVDIANEPGMTGTALFVFLHTPHPTMPNLVLSDSEAQDAIAYILSLKKP